jgi:hypothetical protein
MKQGVQYYGVCNKEDTEAPMQRWRWLANFAMLSLDGVRIKLQVLGARIALDGVRAVGNYDGKKYLATVKIFGGCQNFAKILARQKFVRDSMAGQNYSRRFHMGSPHIKTRRPTKKIPFGDSPLPKRVCAHTGINIYCCVVFLCHLLFLCFFGALAD